jgi:hypothetical protein
MTDTDLPLYRNGQAFLLYHNPFYNRIITIFGISAGRPVRQLNRPLISAGELVCQLKWKPRSAGKLVRQLNRPLISAGELVSQLNSLHRNSWQTSLPTVPIDIYRESE